MLFSFEQFSLVTPFRFVRFKSGRGEMWIATLPFGRSQGRKKGESSFEGRDKGAIFCGRSERGRDEGAIFVGRSARGRDVGKIEKAPLYPLLTDEGTRNNHLFSLFSRGGMWIATLRSQGRVGGYWIAMLRSQ
ncbi:MAG: hypothetical protein ACFN4U_01095 [Candidatus Absconditicoccaceae bacterium]